MARYGDIYRRILRRRLREIRRELPKWRIVTLVFASDYDPKKGPKRNLEIHITLPVSEALIDLLKKLFSEEELTATESEILDNIKETLQFMLFRLGYDIKPLSELKLGIDIDPRVYDVFDIARFRSSVKLYDYDYDTVRAEGWVIGEKARTIEDLIDAMVTIQDSAIPVRGTMRGKWREVGELRKKKVEKLIDKLPENLQGRELTLEFWYS